MSSVSDSIEIDRPPVEVFRYVADVTRRPEWQDAVSAIEVVDASETGVGTVVLETRKVPGGERAFRWKVTEHEEPSRWGLRGVGNPVDAVVAMTFAGSGSGTRVDFDIDFVARSVVWRPLAVLARRQARGEIKRDLANLKRRLESPPGGTP